MAIFLIPLVLFGCGHVDGRINTENSVASYDDIMGLIWETRGGGDIRFTVERACKNFRITIERYRFKSIDAVITLTDKDLEVYELVKGIFEKTINIHDYTFFPQGLTGTWTTITLIFSGNRKVEIEKVDPFGKLRILYDFVEKNTKPGG